jgi:hypothetical protein
MITYANVEDTLALIHGIKSKDRGAFRARIKHIQRIGIVPSSPGKGRKIDYAIEDIFKWAFCLQLIEFSIDPILVKELYEYSWKNVSKYLLSDMKGYFVFHPKFLSSPRSYAGPQQESRPGSRIGLEMFAGVIDSLSAIESDGKLNARLASVNLGILGREVRAALKRIGAV